MFNGKEKNYIIAPGSDRQSVTSIYRIAVHYTLRGKLKKDGVFSHVFAVNGATSES